ncbi:MAG: hypothetical protein R3C24_10970 [Cyanobacteriota/Melainabacteria group bacterium]
MNPKETLSNIANVFSVDQKMMTIAVNDACHKWGYERKVVGRSFFNFLAPRILVTRLRRVPAADRQNRNESRSIGPEVLTVEGQELEILWSLGAADEDGIRYLTATDIFSV